MFKAHANTCKKADLYMSAFLLERQLLARQYFSHTILYNGHQ